MIGFVFGFALTAFAATPPDTIVVVGVSSPDTLTAFAPRARCVLYALDSRAADRATRRTSANALAESLRHPLAYATRALAAGEVPYEPWHAEGDCASRPLTVEWVIHVQEGTVFSVHPMEDATFGLKPQRLAWPDYATHDDATVRADYLSAVVAAGDPNRLPVCPQTGCGPFQAALGQAHQPVWSALAAMMRAGVLENPSALSEQDYSLSLLVRAIDGEPVEIDGGGPQWTLTRSLIGEWRLRRDADALTVQLNDIVEDGIRSYDNIPGVCLAEVQFHTRSGRRGVQLSPRVVAWYQSPELIPFDLAGPCSIDGETIRFSLPVIFDYAQIDVDTLHSHTETPWMVPLDGVKSLLQEIYQIEKIDQRLYSVKTGSLLERNVRWRVRAELPYPFEIQATIPDNYARSECETPHWDEAVSGWTIECHADDASAHVGLRIEAPFRVLDPIPIDALKPTPREKTP